MLEVPGVRVPVPLVKVRLPCRFNTPAPPDISITAVCGVEADELYTILPFSFSVPVVITTLAILVMVVPTPPIFIFPETVAVPAFIFHAVVLLLEVGCVIVTFPFTVNIPEDVCDMLVLLPAPVMVRPVQVLVLLIVYKDFVLNAMVPKLFVPVPLIDFDVPVKVTGTVESVPPLFVQFPGIVKE